MTEEKKPSEPVNVVAENEDEIDLMELARTIWKGKKLIIWIAVIVTLATAALSLTMTNIYTVEAILKPVSSKDGGGRLSSLASQFGGMASLAGITMPGASSSAELVHLLKSNVLSKNIIERYNLLPVLFPKQWDEEKKAWKKTSGGFSLNPLALISKIRPTDLNAPKKDPGVPDMWDGIRALDQNVKINYNMKEDIITITVNFRDPEIAARIANYFIASLNDLMSSEAKRAAITNREYLEKQLLETNDVIVQQKIYNLIAEKIETMMMAEVKEGFAFKVLDPPMAPDQKSKPKRAQMVLVAFMVSLFLAVFVVFFREYVKKIRAKSAGGQNAQ
jgi:uncharacterized protein involved in exopolysaccharide biosynthesis